MTTLYVLYHRRARAPFLQRLVAFVFLNACYLSGKGKYDVELSNEYSLNNNFSMHAFNICPIHLKRVACSTERVLDNVTIRITLAFFRNRYKRKYNQDLRSKTKLWKSPIMLNRNNSDVSHVERGRHPRCS